MDAEERIATLILLGCSFWRRPQAQANDGQARYVYRREFDGAASGIPVGHLLLFNKGISLKVGVHKWRIPVSPYITSNIEIPFDPRLIGFIPETLFMQFVRNLTR